MGYVSREDLLICISAIERGLRELGHKFDFGAGVSAAQQVLFA
jgi:aspartate aminotransferase-like enzyme